MPTPATSLPAADALLEPADAVSIHDVIDGGEVTAAFQPIVDLVGGRVVAFEALARGPEGTGLASPGALFSAARGAGRLADLERLCRIRAAEGALAAGIAAPTALFMNVEPSLVAHEGASLPTPLMRTLLDQMDVVTEITERAVARNPAALVERFHEVRAHGGAYALDDVGVEAQSLALLPFLRPEIVKLDMHLVRDAPDAEIARTVRTVSAYVERTGALLVGEGIETTGHLEQAIAIGATLGQGYRFGRPGAIGTPPGSALEIGVPIDTQPVRRHRTPFDIVSEERRVAVAPKRIVAALSRQLEAAARSLPDRATALATFQDRRYFQGETRERFADLGRRLALVVVVAAGLPAEPAPGVRGISLDGAERLNGEWSVIVTSPDFGGVLVARDLGDAGPDSERRFEYALTHDPALVREAGTALLLRTGADLERAVVPPLWP